MEFGDVGCVCISFAIHFNPFPDQIVFLFLTAEGPTRLIPTTGWNGWMRGGKDAVLPRVAQGPDDFCQAA